MTNYLVKNSLEIETYTVGYNGIGEGSLVLIKVDGSIHLSFLIDYYQKKSSDKLREILEENNIKFLNYIIWTHPHEDHTKGLFGILQAYDSEKTVVLYPAYLLAKDWSNRTEEQQSIISLLRCKQIGNLEGKKIRSDIEPVCGSMDLFRCTYSYLMKKMDLKIFVYTPSLKCVEQHFLLDNEYSVNDFSISLGIEIDESSFIFAGDIQNNSINAVKKHMLPNHKGIEFLKVPHHGSSTSTDILSWIREDLKIGTSVITEYSKSSLPREENIKKYSMKSEKTVVIKKLDTDYDCGIYHGKYNVLTKEAIEEVIGDAIVYTS